MDASKNDPVTGQKIIKITHHDRYVLCKSCKDPEDLVGLHSTAWFDPYAGGKKGGQVHRKCLSKKRSSEIQQATQ